MIQYIANEAHFKEVIALVMNVKTHLWIRSANNKDGYNNIHIFAAQDNYYGCR